MQRFEALGDRLRAFARPWEFACFICVPAIVVAFAGWEELKARLALEDFGIFRTAALAVIHGHSPYVAPNPSAYMHFDRFVYPPVAALLFAPFAALPSGPSTALMFVAGLMAILAALRVLAFRTGAVTASRSSRHRRSIPSPSERSRRFFSSARRFAGVTATTRPRLEWRLP